MYLIPDSHGLREFNPCHKPKGDGGGQFADKGAGNCYSGFRYGPDRAYTNRVQSEWTYQLSRVLTEEMGGVDASAKDVYATIRKRKKTISDQFQRLADKAAVTIRIPTAVLPSILADGRFKSQHETQSSRGNLNPGHRVRVEDTIFGDYTDVRDRPIYGMMIEDVEDAANNESHHAGVSYGETIVVLKDSARARTTMLFGDSLSAEVYDVMPTPITKMTYMAMSPTTSAIHGIGRYTSVDKFKNPYPEAQIHGGVSLDDVSDVYIPYHSVFRGDDPNRTGPYKRLPGPYDVTASMLQRLRDKGITVHVMHQPPDDRED